MAYMVPISAKCQAFGACTRRRTHCVFGENGDNYGEYCTRHAEKRLTELQATEDRHRAASSPAETQKRHFDEAFGEGK